jgi:hypothetical protein
VFGFVGRENYCANFSASAAISFKIFDSFDVACNDSANMRALKMLRNGLLHICKN